MIALPAKTRIWIAAGVTDLRRGFTGLSAQVQTKLEQSPFSGHVFVFRGRRGDLIKVLWYDGDHQQITDAYLLGLAIHHMGKLVTLDRATLSLLPDSTFSCHLDVLDT
jgi:predicted nucleic acid-binding protein